jgi:hypothetical protein
MILQHSCVRTLSIRTFHICSKLSSATRPQVTPIPSTSTSAPFPPKSRPAGNDPLYVHPPSTVKADATLKGIQILKDKPEITALPDDYYPDWLWELLDDPVDVAARATKRRQLEEKKEIYLEQLETTAIAKQLFEAKKSRVVPSGIKRTEEEKKAVRREAQNEVWLLNREREYKVPQFEMPPERNAKYHKKLNREHILQDNYIRARGMK